MKACAGVLKSFRKTLADIEAIGGEAVARKTRKMALELDAFAPSVTFIGQIKSGKTTLVNAMAGRPGLLPADVNPWTSVVTSIHLNMPRPAGAPVASFQFFDADEWDHLVQHGGRIGELSERTGADKELEKLQAQIAAMREKTKVRLGRKFELLLGQVHDYQHLDDDLVQRYVCLGDDFAEEGSKDTQGPVCRHHEGGRALSGRTEPAHGADAARHARHERHVHDARTDHDPLNPRQ